MSNFDMEAIMRRMDEMAASLEEEKRLRVEAEKRWTDLQLSIEQNQTHSSSGINIDTPSQPDPMQTTPNPTMTPPQTVVQPAQIQNVKPPKIATPDKFEGTKGQKAEVFMNQISLYMQMNHASFINEQAQVAFALSYLTGKASVWAQSLIDRLLDSNQMNQVTRSKFVDSFKTTFFDSERVVKAEREIRALKQTKSVADYWIKFSELALVIKWPENVLVSQFEQGLRNEVSVYMVREEFTEVEEMAKFAIKLDNKIHKHTPDVPYQPNATTSTSPTVPSTDPDAMDCLAYRLNISNDEYKRRGAVGACYRCGKTDHYIGECSERSERGRRGGRSNWRGRGYGRFRHRVAELDGVKNEEKVEGRSDGSKNGDAWEC